MKSKKKRKTIDELTQGLEKFVKEKGIHENGTQRFEKTIGKELNKAKKISK